MLALFADDSAFFATSRKLEFTLNRLQRVLDLLPEWLDKWRMAVNVGKTVALLIGRRVAVPPLRLCGQEIEWKTHVTYLGCRIDRSLRMVPQADHAINMAKAARAVLRPVLTSRLPLRTKLAVYKTYIRSRLTYAMPAWYGLCSQHTRQRIQVQQNISLRVLTGAGRYVRNDVIARDVKMQSIEDFVVHTARRMYDKADHGPLSHLCNIAPLHARPPDRSGRALPRELLLPQHAEDVVPQHTSRHATLTDTIRSQPSSCPEPRPGPIPRVRLVSGDPRTCLLRSDLDPARR
ncbi:hypothetical protein ABMA27_013121 [Loxostege sticticalis]|uniref:Reverse transcriptase domain-containing protein n=1 Tax=Loxostege sticticalis TaxID=481309 RepID=A0ABR3IE72_LOXSC